MICLITATILTLNAQLFAAGGKTYEITGTVVAGTGTTLAIQKGTEKYGVRDRSSDNQRIGRTQSRLDGDGQIRDERDQG